MCLVLPYPTPGSLEQLQAECAWGGGYQWGCMGMPIMPGAAIGMPGCIGIPFAIDIMPGCIAIGFVIMPVGQIPSETLNS